MKRTRSEDEDEWGPEEKSLRSGLGLSSPLGAFRLVSMRKKIVLLASLYLCFVSFTAYKTRGVIASNLGTLTGVHLAPEDDSSFFGLEAYHRFLDSDPLGKYDFRDLADRLRQIEGVERVALAGWFHGYCAECSFGSRISVMLHDSSLPEGGRGWGVWVVRGRNIRRSGEVLVSEYTAGEMRLGVGDEVEFIGVEAVVVGIFRIDAAAEPCIVLDLSLIDSVVEGMKESAQELGVPLDRSLTISSEIRVYARSEEDLVSVRDAVVKLEDEWPELKSG